MIPNETFIVVIDYTPSTYISKLFGLLLLGQKEKNHHDYAFSTKAATARSTAAVPVRRPAGSRRIRGGESYALLSLLG